MPSTATAAQAIRASSRKRLLKSRTMSGVYRPKVGAPGQRGASPRWSQLEGPHFLVAGVTTRVNLPPRIVDPPTRFLSMLLGHLAERAAGTDKPCESSPHHLAEFCTTCLVLAGRCA